jgi:hypothetical protein
VQRLYSSSFQAVDISKEAGSFLIKPYIITNLKENKKNNLINASIFISVIKKESGKLLRQPVDFPQRGKSTYSSARSPLPVSKACFHARSPPDGFPTSLPDI